jgi:hypothetical protein
MPSTEATRERAVQDLQQRLPVRDPFVRWLLAQLHAAQTTFTPGGALKVLNAQGEPFASSDPLQGLVDEIIATGYDGRRLPDEHLGEPQLGASDYDQIRAEARASMEQKGYVRRAAGYGYHPSGSSW